MTDPASALSVLTLKLLLENGLVPREVVRRHLEALRDVGGKSASGADTALALLSSMTEPVGGQPVPEAVQLAGIEDFVTRLAAFLDNEAPRSRDISSAA